MAAGPGQPLRDRGKHGAGAGVTGVIRRTGQIDRGQRRRRPGRGLGELARGDRIAAKRGIALAGESGGQLSHRNAQFDDAQRHLSGMGQGSRHSGRPSVTNREAALLDHRAIGKRVLVDERSGPRANSFRLLRERNGPRLGQLASRQPSGLRAERRSLREDKRGRGPAGRGGRPGGQRVEELADRQLGIAGLAAVHVGRLAMRVRQSGRSRRCRFARRRRLNRARAWYACPRRSGR